MGEDIDLKDFHGVGRLFPLPGVVMFPHVVLPLHIFEPRYRQMTEHALADDRLITMIQALPDRQDIAGVEPAIERVGCLGRIVEHERLPDGRYRFLLLGRKRVRILRELDVPTLYRQALVEVIEDLPANAAENSAGRADLSERLLASAPQLGLVDASLNRLLAAELSLGVLTDMLAHALGFPAAMKQSLLDEPDARKRADAISRLLDGLRWTPRRPTYPPPVSPN